MTDERIKYWFNGFEKGITNLSKEDTFIILHSVNVLNKV